MKFRVKSRCSSILPLAAAIAALLQTTTPSAFAAIRYWDTNGTTAGSGGTTPSGTWLNSSMSWGTNNLGTTVGNSTITTSDDVYFASGWDATGAYTITVNAGVSAKSLNFEEGTVTMSGSGSITLGASQSIFVGSQASAIIGNNTALLIAGSNGLTKTGIGTLTLNGNTVNSFTGGLTVNGGTLALDYANLATPTNLINSGNTLTLGGGSLTLKGKTGANATAQTLGNVTVNSGGGSVLIDPNNGTSTTLTLGSLTSTTSGGSLLLGKAVTANTGTVTITTTTDKDATGIYGGRVVFANGTANTGYDWATNTGGAGPFTLSSYSGYSALDTTAGTDTLNSRITASATLGGSRTTNSLKFENPAASQSLALGSNLLTLTSGGLLSTGTNAATISGTAGGTRLTAGNGSGSYDLIVHQFNSGGLDISAVIGDNGANAVNLVKAGSGTLTLSGVNTYTGSTIISSGTVKLSNASALGSTAGTTTVTPNGTLDLNGQTIGETFASINGTLTNSSATPASITSSLGNAAGSNFTVSGTGDITLSNLSSSGAANTTYITKTGAGTLTLKGGAADNASAAAYVYGGTLLLDFSSTTAFHALGGNSYVGSGATVKLAGTGDYQFWGGADMMTVGSGGVLDLNGRNQSSVNNGSNGRFRLNGTGISSGGALVNSASATTSTLTMGTGGLVLESHSSIGGAGNITLSTGVVSGAFNLEKVGAGTLTLNGTNTYSGTTTITGGTLQIGNGAGNGTLSTSSAITNNGTLTFNRTGTIIQGTNFSGSAITGSGNLVKLASGTLTLNAANTYTGTTTVSGGLINLGIAENPGTSGPLGKPTTLANSIVLSGGGLQFTASNTYDYTTSGRLQLADGTTGTIDTNGQNVVFANAFGVGGSQTGALTKTGTGTLTLSGTNTFSGIVTLSAGTLVMGNTQALGTSASNHSLGNGTTLDIATNGGDTAYSFRLGGGNSATLVSNVASGTAGINHTLGTMSIGGHTTSGVTVLNITGGAGLTGTPRITFSTLELSNTNTVANYTTLNPTTAALSIGNVANTGIYGPAGTGTKNLILDGTNAGNEITGTIADGTSPVSTTAVTKSNSSIWTLTGTNTYTGSTTIADNGGTLQVGGSGSLGSGNYSNTVSIGTSATFRYSSSANQTLGGAVSGGGDLTKDTSTSSKLTLTADNSYTGATTISAGTLEVSGGGDINSTSGVTIASGATFRYNSSVDYSGGTITNNGGTIGGTGTIGVAVTLDSLDDVLAPGNSPGIQIYNGAQSWSSFTYAWETNNFTGTTAGTDYDQLGINGSLNLTGSAYALNLLSLTALNATGNVANFTETNRTWTILTTTGGISNFDASEWAINTGGFTSSPSWTGTWSLTQSGSNLVLNYNVVPEPGSALLGCSGVLMLLGLRRRTANKG